MRSIRNHIDNGIKPQQDSVADKYGHVPDIKFAGDKKKSHVRFPGFLFFLETSSCYH